MAHLNKKYRNDTERLCKEFKKILFERDMPVYKCAQKAGIAEGTLRLFLNGEKSNITFLSLMKIADALDLELYQILRNIPSSKNNSLSHLEFDENVLVKILSSTINLIREEEKDADAESIAKSLCLLYEIAMVERSDLNKEKLAQQFSSFLRKFK